jgi:hypothetical protein
LAPTTVSISAARGGSLELLQWLDTVGESPDKSDAPALQEMLFLAGIADSVECCKWLRSRGALWPAKLWSVDPYGMYWECWGGDVLTWAKQV